MRASHSLLRSLKTPFSNISNQLKTSIFLKSTTIEVLKGEIHNGGILHLDLVTRQIHIKYINVSIII